LKYTQPEIVDNNTICRRNGYNRKSD